MATYPYNYIDYQVDRDTKIATVTLNNPSRRNAAPTFAEDQLIEAIDAWESDDNVKVVIIKGAGDHFCAGHDVGAYNEVFKVGRESRRNLRDSLVAQREVRMATRRLLFSLKPTIAQVHGLCIEFGNAVQVCCDITIAANDAHIGNLGQTAGICGITIIRLYMSLIGHKRMREMMISGRTWSGREASQIGLVNRAVSRARLDAEVLNEAKRIALLPIDGLVAGKAYTHMVYESMGFGASFTENSYFHALGLKLSFEPDDFAFFKQAGKVGMKEAAAMRAKRYAPLGGFGADDERPIVEG